MPEIEEIKAEIQEMFSADAVSWGVLIVVSGCVPLDTEGKRVGAGDIEAQSRKTLEILATG
ncbi:MAG: RidA family protein, partial [Solirubrobacterales bacterium]